jgi:hypothetical protein
MAHGPSGRAPGAHDQTPGAVALVVPIGRLCCAGCARLVEHRLRDDPRVRRVRALAMSASSITVVSNALLLRREA